MEMLTRDSRVLVGQGGEEIHPLFNTCILRNIFRDMDVKTLKSVRETCTFWNEEAKSFLQKRAKITITWYNERDRRKIATLPTFMKYVESVSPKNVFFRNFVLYDWRLHSREEEMTEFWLECGEHIRNLVLKGPHFAFYEESYVQNVFFNWTPNMESLQISNVRFLSDPNYEPRFMKKDKGVRDDEVDEDTEYESDSEEEMNVEEESETQIDGQESDGEEESDDEEESYYYDVESESEAESDDVSTLKPMKKCEVRENIQPNYNFLTFSMEPSLEYSNFPLEWKELFVSYPNLKRLCFNAVYYKDEFDILKPVLTDLIEFQDVHPEKFKNLKHLDVFIPAINEVYGDYSLADEQFEQVMKLKFKLESLNFYFNNNIEDLTYDIVGKYIAKLSPTLKTMDILCNVLDFAIFPPLGRNKILFPNLKDLSIDINALSSNNVDFLEQTPRLETLSIGELTDDEPERLFCNTITMLPLNSLRHLFIQEDILTEDCVRKIGEWFPNLMEFGARLDDKLLWAVYKFLNNSVEKLSISAVKGKRMTDAGITGMEIEATNKSDGGEPKPSSSKRIKLSQSNDAEKLLYCIGVSIGQMKKLRRVSIRNSNKEGIKLTDDSVYNGFVLLNELTSLDLDFCQESITEEAWRDLCTRRNIMTLNTANFYRGHGVSKTKWLNWGWSVSKIEI